MDIMEKKKNFSQKALNYLNYIFLNGEQKCIEEDNKHLILSTYMMIFSRIYDDREKVYIEKDERDNIINTCYISEKDMVGKYEKDKELGRPFFDKDSKDYKHLKAIYVRDGSESKGYKIAFAEAIINNTRDAIMHGNFYINEENATVILWENYRGGEIDGKERFKIKYDFDCLIDICKILSEKEEIKQYMFLLDCASKGNRIPVDDNKLLYFDALINILVSYNQKYIRNNSRKISDTYGIDFTGGFDERIRNSVVHQYRELNGNNIRVLDYYKKNDRKKGIAPSEDRNIDFSKILSLGQAFRFELIDSIPDKKNSIDDNIL